MSSLRPAHAGDIGRLFLLGAIWGSSFLSIELALHWLPPLSIAASRVLLAGATLWLMLRLMGQSLPDNRRDWSLCLLVGLLNSALPFALISWGQQFITSGRSAILIACGPFLALVLAHLFTRDDRLTLPKVVGVMLGFGGILSLIGVDVLKGDDEAVIGQLAVALAALCYALSSLLTRRLSHLPTLVSTTAMMLVGAAIGLPVLLLGELPDAIDWRALAALVWLGLFPTALAYLLRVQLIQQIGTTFMSQVAYLIPLFAVFWGWLFLDEQPTTGAWLALGLTLAGIGVSRLRTRATQQGTDAQSAPK